MAVIRVSFQLDDSPATTGRGQFVLEDSSEIVCSEWQLDPPPHDRSYFEDHLTAAGNYWEKVSNDHVSIDLERSQVFPAGLEDSYVLPHNMLYYHPYLEANDETAKLMELSRDALALADPDIDFTQYTTVILVHAGMGGDFAFALDPTPGNIPSAYLSQPDFSAYGALTTDEGALTDLIIIPESQNFLQYEETRLLFEGAQDPCFYQVALNGTLALMLGFHLGLPPLYNAETGRSLVGGFALMDQGSNNFHGVVPAYPDPYTRIRAGWINPQEAKIGQDVAIGVDDPPVRVSISSSEYFLLENRQRNRMAPSEMEEWIDSLAYDTVSVELSARGVVLAVDEQHAGLPGNGLYIWHINENAWYEDSNPNGGPRQLVDFVEADGAQDMGFTTQILFGDYLETGWWFDPWYAGNEGYFHMNRNVPIVGDSLLTFGPGTRPATRASDGTATHLSIENISKNGSIMTFSVRSDRMLNSSSVASLMGWGTNPGQLWAFNADSSAILDCRIQGDSLLVSESPSVSPDQIFADNPGKGFQFSAPWIIPNRTTGARFINILTGWQTTNALIDAPREFRDYGQYIRYLGHQDDGFAVVHWQPGSGTTTITPLVSEVMTEFLTPSGFLPIYGSGNTRPLPLAVSAAGTDNNGQLLDQYFDILSWSVEQAGLKINHYLSDTEQLLTVDRPLDILPVDIHGDGRYELALFYEREVRIISVSGINWDGSPFQIEPYYGSPLILPILNDAPEIFLRHGSSYSIHSLAGETLERGLLSSIDNAVENQARVTPDTLFVLTGQEILRFPGNSGSLSAENWTTPRGNIRGDRTVLLTLQPPARVTDLKPGSVYNYPNPVKGSRTTIRAWLGEVDSWSVEIFSLSGAQVAYENLDAAQPNAYNEWIWDASDISNGVFVAQIKAGNDAQIIKIAIVR